MSWSLNEVEGLARKAARGSGLSWGLAEEAGKATRWLASVGLPGPDLLSRLLTRNDGMSYAALCPIETGGTWTAEEGRLCPLVTGAVICDHAARLARGGEINIGGTSYPLLLLPFAAGAANMAGKTVEITWPGLSALVGPDGAVSMSNAGGRDTDFAEDICIRTTERHLDQPLNPVSRADLPEPIAKTLGNLAHRTFAPDTPESRLAGAGAGLTDND